MYQLLWHWLAYFNTVSLNVSCDSQKKRVTMNLNIINQMVFVIEGHYAFCKVGTKFLNIFQINFNILIGDTDSLKNNMWDVAINIKIIFKTFFINRITQMMYLRVLYLRVFSVRSCTSLNTDISGLTACLEVISWVTLLRIPRVRKRS